MYWNYRPSFKNVDLTQTATAFSVGGNATAVNNATVIQG
jgi:hypothetical protein